jgi:hypothetical protein
MADTRSRRPGRPTACTGTPAPRQVAAANLAQLQSEIQGSYDTHAGQIDCISFFSRTTRSFKG